MRWKPRMPSKQALLPAPRPTLLYNAREAFPSLTPPGPGSARFSWRPTMRNRPRFARALVDAASLFAPIAFSQEDQTQVPRFRAGVNAVLVDVVVIDADGQPVAGLTAEDFQV